MVLTARLEGRPVRIMLDSGANQNYASLRLWGLLPQQRRNKENPYPLTMADGTPVDYEGGWIKKELREVELRIGTHDEKITLDIMSIKYDIVLGMT